MPTRMHGKIAASLMRWAMGAPEDERRKVEVRLRQHVNPEAVAHELRCEGIDVLAVGTLTIDIEAGPEAIELTSAHPSVIAVVEKR